MEEQVQTLNYSLHAIEDIGAHLEAVVRQMPKSGRAMRKMLELVDRAVKFILPNCAEFVDLTRLSETHFDMLRLPFPLVALEVPWQPEDARIIEEGIMKESASSKRLVLAWDETFAKESQVCAVTEPGIWVVPIYYDDNIQHWLVGAVGAFIPRQNTFTRLEGGHAAESPDAQMLQELLLNGGWVKPGAPGHQVSYFKLLPELFDRLAEKMGDTTAAMARAQLDVRDELHVLWQFCLTVNCVNIEQVDVPAPPALNKKRIKNGKRPFFSYKVLQLPAEPVAPSGKRGQTALEGHRASPRMHLRRGHPRRLSSGKVTFVRATIIGSAQAGVVGKTYSLHK